MADRSLESLRRSAVGVRSVPRVQGGQGCFVYVVRSPGVTIRKHDREDFFAACVTAASDQRTPTVSIVSDRSLTLLTTRVVTTYMSAVLVNLCEHTLRRELALGEDKYYN